MSPVVSPGLTVSRPPSLMRRTLIYVGITLVVLLLVVVGVLSYTTKVKYQNNVLKAREAALREDLSLTRGSIKQYAHDQNAPPQSLADLVKAGYLREIPIDPITGRRDWQVTLGKYEYSSKTLTGITDVRSASSLNSSAGTPYNQW
jgi:general secretion pathway protein G